MYPPRPESSPVTFRACPTERRKDAAESSAAAADRPAASAERREYTSPTNETINALKAMPAEAIAALVCQSTRLPRLSRRTSSTHHPPEEAACYSERPP